MKYWLRIAYTVAWGAWFATAMSLTIASLMIHEWIAVPHFSAEATMEGSIIAALFFAWFYLAPGLLLVGRNYLARRFNASNN